MRRLTPGLAAKQALEPTTVYFSPSAPWSVKPGDWIVTLGTDVVDVVSPKEFPTKYAFIEEGTLIPRADCTRIEEITGVGTARTAEDLYQAVDRLARIAIGDVQVRFTPGQLEEIKHRARKRGLTVPQELQRIVDRIKDEIFYKS